MNPISDMAYVVCGSRTRAAEIGHRLTGCTWGDWVYDSFKSSRAGYSIFTFRDEPEFDVAGGYVCDLGDRFEINYPDGETINVWYEYA